MAYEELGRKLFDLVWDYQNKFMEAESYLLKDSKEKGMSEDEFNSHYESLLKDTRKYLVENIMGLLLDEKIIREELEDAPRRIHVRPMT